MLRRAIAKKLPRLGLYQWADPTTEAPALQSDAANDAADIACELAKGLRRYGHLGEQDAVWHLALTFRTHWVRHLFNLRSYLHGFIAEA